MFMAVQSEQNGRDSAQTETGRSGIHDEDEDFADKDTNNFFCAYNLIGCVSLSWLGCQSVFIKVHNDYVLFRSNLSMFCLELITPLTTSVLTYSNSKEINFQFQRKLNEAIYS